MKRWFSIRLLMLLVVVFALDFSILRGWLSSYFDPGIAYVTLPVGNGLILAAPRTWAAGPGRAFWIGFEAVGWCMVLLFGLLAHFQGWRFFWLANQFDHLWQTRGNPSLSLAVMFAVDFACYTPAQVLAAWAGGRLGVRIARGRSA